MRTHLQQLLQQALQPLKNQWPADAASTPQVERTRDRAHGDFASNIALLLAKPARRKPRELAEKIVACLPASEQVAKVEIAGPGFINFFLTPVAYHQGVRDILAQGEGYGRSQVGGGRRVQVEFVSSNPTGPLHVGHGRHAAFGATLANLLAAAGFAVQREYYLNDAGRQMDILAVSVWLRYLERYGEVVPFPANGYRGDYVRDIAEQCAAREGPLFVVTAHQITAGLPPDESQGGDKEAHIDALIARAKQLIGVDQYRRLYDLGLDAMVENMREDLAEFGVVFDRWFSERSLAENGEIDQAIARLQAAGQVYEQDGALWFRSSAFGDEKDRVVRRKNGQTTYFASDIAYLMDKFERGFERILYVWGADHHGYIPRLKAACAALGYDLKRLEVLLVQFVNLYRGGERVAMSTRAGDFVPLRELRREVGNDAARFFYVARKHEQHLDFDLDLAKSQSKDNPVYYIQYAHARVSSVLARLAKDGGCYDPSRGLAHLRLLTEPHEEALLIELSRYPEVVEAAALNYDPQQLAHYLRDLANAFHVYYNEHRVLVDEAPLRDARLSLSLAVRQVIKNGLALLGVHAPEVM